MTTTTRQRLYCVAYYESDACVTTFELLQRRSLLQNHPHASRIIPVAHADILAESADLFHILARKLKIKCTEILFKILRDWVSPSSEGS